MLGSVTGELGKHFVGVQPFHKTPFTAVLDQYQEGGPRNSQVEVDRESMRQILSLFALKHDTVDSQLRRS